MQLSAKPSRLAKRKRFARHPPFAGRALPAPVIVGEGLDPPDDGFILQQKRAGTEARPYILPVSLNGRLRHECPCHPEALAEGS